MLRDEVLTLWRQRPFVPFRITTVVGETIDVAHPGLMLVAGDTITIGTPDPHHPPPAADELLWLDFEHIAQAEPLDSISPRS
jgi:hypothetical protein